MSWLLHLLPRRFRAEFGDEILLTLSARAAEARGPRQRIGFWSRELPVWCGLALQQHARAGLLPGPGPTVTAIGAGVGAGALWLGGELVASHGIYWRAAHPFALLAIVLLGAVIGWELAATRSPRQRLYRCSALLVLLLVFLPVFRLADHAYLAQAAQRGPVAFTIPGIELRSELLTTGVAAPPASRHDGFRATRYHTGISGARLRTIWQRSPDAPPYLSLAMLLLLVCALTSRAARLRWAR